MSISHKENLRRSSHLYDGLDAENVLGKSNFARSSGLVVSHMSALRFWGNTNTSSCLTIVRSCLAVVVLAATALTTSSHAFSTYALAQSADESAVFDIRGAIAQALIDDPRALIARSDVSLAENSIAEANSLFYPNVNALANMTQTRSDYSTGFVVEGFIVEDSTSTSKTASVNVGYNLFRGFSDVARQNSANLRADVSRLQLEDTLVSVAQRIAIAYVNYRTAVLVEQLRVSELRTADSLRNAVRQRRAAGDAGASELAYVEARRSRSNNALIMARSNVQSWRAELLILIGDDYASQIDRSNLPPLTIEPSYLPNSLEQALEMAPLNNRNFGITDRRIDIAKAGLGVAMAEFYPTVDLIGTVGVNLNEKGGAPDKFARFGVEAKVNLSNGFASTARQSSANVRIMQAESRRDDLAREIDLAIRKSWLSYSAADDSINAAKLEVGQMRRVYRNAVNERNVGIRDINYVLDAQSDLNDAGIRLLQSEQSKDMSAISLLGAVGSLASDAFSTN